MNWFANLFYNQKAPSNTKPSASSFEGPPVREAVDYAKTLHSKILKDFDQQTQTKVAQIISDGIKNKRGLPGISRDVQKAFPVINKTTANNLVQTETNYALSLASIIKMKQMGVDGKEWIVIGDDCTCEICAKNASIGVIPVEQMFPSGHMHPPLHDGCRCALAPARLNRKK